VNTETLAELHVRARVVVLAASCCESARLLLNSTSSRFPNGLANSSGVVGKYLTDSTGLSVQGFIPALQDLPRYNSDGAGGAHLYVPWWGNNRALGFPRGYHIELGGGFGMPGYGFGGGVHNYPGSRGGGYGADLKAEYRRYYGAFVNFAGRGEQVAREDCSCEIDPNVVDKWGIPVLRFNHTWSDHERLQAKHMQETFRTIIQEMGGTPTSAMPTVDQNYGLAVGGLIIHEAGATRMGNDPRTSVLNRNGQAHDVKNLFVADGGPFVSQADKNLTWTIMALAWRTAEFLADERRRGNL
jgi:choline dehydrogenase-like flavoprotein